MKLQHICDLGKKTETQCLSYDLCVNLGIKPQTRSIPDKTKESQNPGKEQSHLG